MATIALRTKANGLASFAGLAALDPGALVVLLALGEVPLALPLALPLEAPELAEDEDPRELVALSVGVLKVALRVMGMPEDPKLPTVPAVPAVPNTMGVVALRGMAVVATMVVLSIAVTE